MTIASDVPTRATADRGGARTASVPDLVAARAAEAPDALAVTAGPERMTYAELDRRANRIAAHLHRLGVGPDTLVGLCLPRSLDMVAGALGILRAGGAYLPMDPAYPAERLAFMLEDAQAPVLISTAALARQLPGGRRTLLEPGALATMAWPGELPPAEIAPDGLAYLIYTSGSTGTPKGVEITHANLTHLVAWHRQTFAVTAGDRASHVAGLGFDAAVWELWPYLAAGASVHLADEVARNSAELLRDWLVAERITIGFVPTPLAERLLAQCTAWPADTALRVLLTGGDALHRYPPAGLPFALVNNYGPTECTVVATSGVVPPLEASAAPAAPPPIGCAIAGTRVHLLDDRLQPVPAGTPGELYIGGAGVGRGYRGRPEQTAERFLPDPFDAAPGARLYRTGDVGCLLPDGQIAFLGRRDDQIKLRGYRIEPNEIVRALDRHPGVRASQVVARTDDGRERRLVAYVVVDAERVPTHAELRELLRGSLPEYMIPAAFVRLEAFPLTTHGKVDRAALPAPTPANTLPEDAAETPCTPTEQRVAEIVGDLLQLEEIDLDDNFFLLGGHSLLGAQLMARLRDAFGVELGLRTLFEAPTVAALAAAIERLGAGAAPMDSAPAGADG
ncbi:MAG TPA: non-ribosomal peptide synthetase [Gemmatimonadales bacterium]|nr:non-ribosomal peptide synthetase [Gemmatimonadales bacterium]